MLFHKKYFKSDLHEWVVFIHGAGGSSAVWYKQLKSFKEEFNVLLLDLRGHGKTPSNEKETKNYSFEMIAHDVIEIIDFLKIKKAHFVGVSLGTLIIRQLGDMIQDRMHSMILVGAITRFNLKSRFWVSIGRIFKNVMPYMWLYKIFAFVIMPSKNHSEARNLFINEAKKLCQKEFLRWFRLTGQLKSLFEKFEDRIQIPVLFVMGDQDYLFLEPVKHLTENVKNTFLWIVEECGHVVNVEKPDIFNSYVIRYLHNLKSNPELSWKV
jgi:pimeloyl-ACP methyl ester carboxylesterase